MRDFFKRAFNILFAYDQEQQEGKSPLRSKTIWAMIVSTAAVLMSKHLGIELSAEEQTMIVAAVGIVMRLVTKSPVGFYEEAEAVSDEAVPQTQADISPTPVPRASEQPPRGIFVPPAAEPSPFGGSCFLSGESAGEPNGSVLRSSFQKPKQD